MVGKYPTLLAMAFVLTLTTLALPVSAQQTLFTNQAPVITGVTGANELGMKFQSSVNGTISAIRFWKDPSETGTHVGNIWDSTGHLRAHVTFANETASGWQQAVIPPLTISANTTYVVSVNDNTAYVATNSGPFYPILNSDAGLYFPIVNGPLTSLADGNNGVFGTPGLFPTQSFEFSNYFRDVVFTPASGSTSTQPEGCLEKLVSVDGGSTFAAYPSFGSPALVPFNGAVEFELVVTNCGSASITIPISAPSSTTTIDDCINANANAAPFACAPGSAGGQDAPGLILYEPGTNALGISSAMTLTSEHSATFSKIQLPALLVSATQVTSLCQQAMALTGVPEFRNDAEFDGFTTGGAPIAYNADAYIACAPPTPPPPITSSCVVINAALNVPIPPVTLTATGGVGGPYTFTATGLPPGLTISPSGTISGTPTVGGTFNYTVTITDSAGHTGTLNCSVTVPPTSACVIGPASETISNTSWNKFNIPDSTCPLVWVHAQFNQITGIPKTSTTTLTFSGVSFVLNGTVYPMPNGVVIFNPSASSVATTVFSGGTWTTTINPNNISSENFFTGAAIPVDANITGGGQATIQFTATSSVKPISFQWQWSAAVYTLWPADWNQAGIQPYQGNGLHADTPTNTTVQKSLIQGPRGGGGSNFTGSWSATGKSGPCL